MKTKKLGKFIRITTIYIGMFLFILVLRGFYVCPFKKYLNIECFGCGMTRAFFAFLNLDFKSAFALNPLIFLFFPLVVIFYFYYIFKER